MSKYIVIENNDGLMVTEVSPEESNTDAASRNAGSIVDEGPYHSYEEAYDAMMQVPDDEKERARLRE